MTRAVAIVSVAGRGENISASIGTFAVNEVSCEAKADLNVPAALAVGGAALGRQRTTCGEE